MALCPRIRDRRSLAHSDERGILSTLPIVVNSEGVGSLKEIFNSHRLLGRTKSGTDDVYTEIGDWSPDGIILFCKQNFEPISKIAASRGPVSPATRLSQRSLRITLHSSFPTTSTSFMPLANSAARLESKSVRLVSQNKKESRLAPALMRHLRLLSAFRPRRTHSGLQSSHFHVLRRSSKHG